MECTRVLPKSRGANRAGLAPAKSDLAAKTNPEGVPVFPTTFFQSEKWYIDCITHFGRVIVKMLVVTFTKFDTEVMAPNIPKRNGSTCLTNAKKPLKKVPRLNNQITS